MWSLFKVWISTDATASLLEADTCSPKDETEMFSWLVGWSCNWLASSCVIKERWAPSSNRMWPSTVVCPAETFEMAVFNKHTLVGSAESDLIVLSCGRICQKGQSTPGDAETRPPYPDTNSQYD